MSGSPARSPSPSRTPSRSPEQRSTTINDTISTEAVTASEVTTTTSEIGFTTDSYSLRTALQLAGRAVAKRGGALPVLSGVRVTVDAAGVHVLGSDLELTMSCDVDVTSANGVGVTVLPWKQLIDLTDGATTKKRKPVTVTTDGPDEATVTVGNRTRAMRVLPADEFPRLAAHEPSGMEFLDTAHLGEIIPAASTDDARPILTGILIGDGRIVATDSYRIYYVDGPDLNGTTMLVPSRAAAEVVRIGGEAIMSWEEGTWREAHFEWPDRPDRARVVSRLIEGEFPNYKGLIPASHPNAWTFADTAEVIEALKGISKFVGAGNTPVRIRPNEAGSGFTMEALMQDVGLDQFEVAGTAAGGEDLTVAFNPAYLLDLVKSLGDDPFVLETVDAQKPALAKGSMGRGRLLMPVRVT